MKKSHRRLVAGAAGLAAAAVAVLSANPAQAAELSDLTEPCAMRINIAASGVDLRDHVAVLAHNNETPNKQHRLFIAWMSGGGWWSWFNPGTVPLSPTQMACGYNWSATGYDNQGVIVYRDLNSNLKARDRRGGWAETDLQFKSPNKGLWGALVRDNGVLKYALFVPGFWNDNHLYMIIWDENANPKWRPPVDLGAIPDGIALGGYMGGYTFGIGPNPAQWQMNVSVFFSSAAGTLIENTGPLTGSRTWVNHGLLPGEGSIPPRRVLPDISGRPSGVAWVTEQTTNTNANHWNKRLVVNGEDTTTGSPNAYRTFARVQSGTGAWSWQLLTDGNPVVFAKHPRAALTAGCQFGWCQPKTITMAIGPLSSGPRFYRHESVLQGVGSWTQTSMNVGSETITSLIQDYTYFRQNGGNFALWIPTTGFFWNIGHP